MDRARDRESPHRASAPAGWGRGVDEPYAIVEETPAPHAERSCPVCLRRLPPDATACVACRFDPGVGLTASTIVAGAPLGQAGLTCAGCGHDLRGAAAPRCPECGRTVGRNQPDRRAVADAAIAEHEHIRIPLVVVAIAAGLLLLLVGFIQSPFAAGALLLSIAIFVPCCATLLKLAGLFGLEIDGTWPMTTLQVAAATLVVAVTITVGMLVIPWILALILAIVVAVAVVEQLFELEREEAVKLAAIIGMLYAMTLEILAWRAPLLFAGLF